MTLRDLTKPQSDACHIAARIILSGNIDRSECRQAYREALTEFEQTLVEPAEARSLVQQAMRAQINDALADIISGMPVKAVGV